MLFKFISFAPSYAPLLRETNQASNTSRARIVHLTPNLGMRNVSTTHSSEVSSRHREDENRELQDRLFTIKGNAQRFGCLIEERLLHLMKVETVEECRAHNFENSCSYNFVIDLVQRLNKQREEADLSNPLNRKHTIGFLLNYLRSVLQRIHSLHEG